MQLTKIDLDGKFMTLVKADMLKMLSNKLKKVLSIG